MVRLDLDHSEMDLNPPGLMYELGEGRFESNVGLMMPWELQADDR